MRRLLDLHDVSYVESDKVRKLRGHLKAFLTRVKNGKRADGTLPTGSAKKSRARESDRLRAEWPQLVSDTLKHKLLDRFGLRISSETLRTFTCGSCSEKCPLSVGTTIRLADFKWDLLKRPDLAGESSEIISTVMLLIAVAHRLANPTPEILMSTQIRPVPDLLLLSALVLPHRISRWRVKMLSWNP